MMRRFYDILWKYLIRRLGSRTVTILVRILFIRSWIRFGRWCRDPMKYQKKFLMQLIKKNRSTEFGIEHRFSEIESIEDFKRNVPVSGYSRFQPYVERMLSGGRNILLSDDVIFFAITSGTTGKPKFIPVTRSYARTFQLPRRVWMRQVVLQFPKMLKGTVLTVQSPSAVGKTDGGIPYGSITSLIGSEDFGLGLARPFSKIPRNIYLVEDFDTRYYLMLRCALQLDISIISAVNPSTVLLFCRKLNEFSNNLIRDCREGGLSMGKQLDKNLFDVMKPYIESNPTMAEKIERSIYEHGFVKPVKIWETLCGILCWKGGMAPFYLSKFPKYFGNLKVMDFGYAATEGNFSIPIDSDGAKGVLVPYGTFLEFLPVEQRDEKHPEIVTMDKLQVGKRYYVILSGENGLYRYDINDIVEVVGFYKKTPEIAFVQKGCDTLSVTGEKVTEGHVNEAIKKASAMTSIDLKGFCVGIDLSGDIPYYVFVVEPETPDIGEHPLKQFLMICEQELKEMNIEYKSKRESQRIGDPVLWVMSAGSFECWRRTRLKQNAHDAHLKLPHVVHNLNILSSFGRHREVS